jgi:hypothetical protein
MMPLAFHLGASRVIRTKPAPVATRESKAAATLRMILKKDCRNHGLKLADIVGIYPA